MPKDKHDKGAEHNEAAEKAHRTASEHHGKDDRGAGHEHSKFTTDHSKKAHDQSMDAMKASEEKVKK